MPILYFEDFDAYGVGIEPTLKVLEAPVLPLDEPYIIGDPTEN